MKSNEIRNAMKVLHAQIEQYQKKICEHKLSKQGYLINDFGARLTSDYEDSSYKRILKNLMNYMFSLNVYRRDVIG